MTLLINEHEFPFEIPADDPGFDYICGNEVDLRGRLYYCCGESAHDGSCWAVQDGILVAIWDAGWDVYGRSGVVHDMRVNGMDVAVDPSIPRSAVSGESPCPDGAEELPSSKSYGKGTTWVCTVHIDDLHIATAGKRWLGIYTQEYYENLTQEEEDEVVFDITVPEMDPAYGLD